MKIQIITISNNAGQYAAMKASFIAAGFDESRVRFTRLDNSEGNRHEPYEVLRTLDTLGEEPTVILCHQDIRLDLGDGFDALMAILREMDRRDPRWAVLGNAGSSRRARLVRYLDDPYGRHRDAGLPRRAMSLDENLLIIRRGAGPLASDGLSGFHLYGTDACLCATMNGRTCYVVPFLLTHLSAGNAASSDFNVAKERLIEVWKPRVLSLVIITTCTPIAIGATPAIERAAKHIVLRRIALTLGLAIIWRPGWRSAARRIGKTRFEASRSMS